MTDKKLLLRLLAIATMFAYEALLLILIGWWLGRYLDTRFGTHAVFEIVLMIVLALAAVRNLMVRVYRLGVRKND